jgi:hypothetical protein
LRTWIERVSAGPGFAGKEGNHLDRFKAMRWDGWDLEVVIVGGGEVVALGRYRGPEYVPLWSSKPRTALD